MKKLSLILAVLLCALMVFSCGEEAKTNESATSAEDLKTNNFTFSLEDTITKAESELSFDGAQFMQNTDEGAVDILMWRYGIEDEALIAQIDSYLLSVPGTNSAKTLAVLIFKEGTKTETVDSIEKLIKDIYIKQLINSTAMYDQTQCIIAEEASFIRYDNALVVVAYDTEGNTAATDVLFK